MAKIENVEDFGKHFAPDLIRCDLIKNLVAIQMLTNPLSDQDDFKKREMVHIMMVGDVSSGKSDILSEVANCHPTAKFVSSDATKAGLRGVATKDGIDGGVFEGADGGILALDEMSDLKSEVRRLFLEPLQTGIVTTTAWGASQPIKARINLLAAANPKGGTWRGGVNRQFIPFDTRLLSRLHFIVPIVELEWREYTTSLAEAYKKRERRTGKENKKRNEEIRGFIEQHIEEIPHVLLRDNDIDRIFESVGRLKKSYSSPKTPVGTRTSEGMMNACKGKARLEGRSEVSDDDVDYVLSTIEKLFKWWHLSL